jgi:Spy/CpxP family protein refolding chaperone
MKKSTFNIMVIFVALSFMACLSPFAFAQDASVDEPDTQQNTAFQRKGEMRDTAKNYRNARGLRAGSLTEEQIEKIKEAKSAFQTATQDLRMEIQSKKLALQSELVKKEPDVKAAKALQKEISSLTAELAMQRLDHVLDMKEINPYAGTGQLKNKNEAAQTGRGRNT